MHFLISQSVKFTLTLSFLAFSTCILVPHTKQRSQEEAPGEAPVRPVELHALNCHLKTVLSILNNVQKILTFAMCHALFIPHSS